MYLSTGPLGAVNAGGDALSDPIGSGAFMVSLEYQLTPADAGGIYNLGPIGFQKAARAPVMAMNDDWNQIDIVVENGATEHLLNGQHVTGGTQIESKWPGQPVAPLSCGKLQIQSEGAEIFFRHLEIRALTAPPP